MFVNATYDRVHFVLPFLQVPTLLFHEPSSKHCMLKGPKYENPGTHENVTIEYVLTTEDDIEPFSGGVREGQSKYSKR